MTNLEESLALAIKDNDVLRLREILYEDVNVNAEVFGVTPLTIAIVDFHPEILSLLIHNNVDVNLPIPISNENFKGYTPLNLAVRMALDSDMSKSIEMINMLIDAGADVNATNTQDSVTFANSTSFEIAVSLGMSEIAEIFVKKGLNVNKEITKHKLTPLAIAIDFGDCKLVKLLIENGADVNSIINHGPRKGFTILALSILNLEHTKQFEIVNILLDKGAYVNAVITNDKFKGLTILAYAITLSEAFKEFNLIKLLLDHGADSNAVMGAGKYAGLTILEMFDVPDGYPKSKILKPLPAGETPGPSIIPVDREQITKILLDSEVKRKNLTDSSVRTTKQSLKPRS